MKDIVLIGAGGHCVSVIDVIESTKMFNIVGILDSQKVAGEKVLNYEVLGNDSLIHSFDKNKIAFAITVGQIKNVQPRIDIANLLSFYNCPTIIASTAYVSKYAKVGRGTIIMHHALVNANTNIGEFCILNTKSLIEHDSTIGNFTHISTGAILNGNCTVMDEVFIGSNTTLMQGVQISKGNVVSAGSFIKRSI
jgi:sugar O-acyltransferase (sialic acid O-acetyltransferase NeuD family)